MKAKFDDVIDGDILIADGGFDCIAPGPHKVHVDPVTGIKWINCASGRHNLEGQLDDSDVLVGLTWK